MLLGVTHEVVNEAVDRQIPVRFHRVAIHAGTLLNVLANVHADMVLASVRHHFHSGAASVARSPLITALFALTTALRPHPWYDPRYAVSLAGILLGNILNATSLSLDRFLGAIARERPAVEARLTLGATYWEAASPFVRDAIRRGLVPIINQMSAAGVVTLPVIMTGQILAGLDPMEAVKYQILLMFLLSGGSGLAAAITAYLAAWRLTDPRERLRLDRLKSA